MTQRHAPAMISLDQGRIRQVITNVHSDEQGMNRRIDPFSSRLEVVPMFQRMLPAEQHRAKYRSERT
ncbi:MAG TPA: hypothetical protein VGL94_22500 [Ktedonobacteraceae bacterium]